MVNVATVHLWNKRIGAVSWDADRQVALFQYYPDFANNNILEPSTITMPAKGAQNTIYQFSALPKDTFQGLPGMLADSLPDKFGNTVLDEWLSRTGRTKADMNPIEKLCYIGNRGMGALEYSPALHERSTAAKIDIEEMTALVADILSRREQLKTSADSAEMMKDILSIGTSAGGARAKAVIAINDMTGEIISGQVTVPEGFTHTLLKFDGVDQSINPQGFGRIEYAYYKMALDCGIAMSECRLLEIGNHAHFMTKRFDRQGNKKLHMQSLCGLAHFDFNNPAAYSYEDAFQVMRSLRLPYGDAEQMFRRMVFNVLTYNRDDHTKNIAFLMNGQGQWSLAPAFDMTFSYKPDSIWVSRHQMSVNGKRDNITEADMLAIANTMNIKKPKAIFEQIQSVAMNWLQYAKDSGVSEPVAKEILKIIKSKN